MNPRVIVKTAIVGTGFAGLGMAMRLRDEGDDDFLLFEKADGVGGVWRDNVYPGCGCDIQSHLYAFSFAPKSDWSRVFASQPEILAYLAQCVRDRGLEPFLRLGEDVLEARWDDDEQLWRIATSKGAYAARFLVLAVGALSDPRVPDFPGLAAFPGPMFHTARWRRDVDLGGKRVAVIGTGASAIQVVPELQPVVRELRLFQRTPPWIMRRGDKAISAVARWLYANMPSARRLLRFALRYVRELSVLVMTHPALGRPLQVLVLRQMRRRVKDPQKRSLAEPSYAFACKRVLISDNYLEAIDRANVTLETATIERVEPTGVRTLDGTLHEVDVIIFATGFGLTTVPLYKRVIGRQGIPIIDAWAPTAKAYYGSTVPGFPNMFMMQGPNSGLGHNSVVLMIEAQIAHVLGAMRYVEANRLASVEVSATAVDELMQELDGKLARSVWQTGGCRSWYLDDNGHNFALWPGTAVSFEQRARRFDPTAYVGRR